MKTSFVLTFALALVLTARAEDDNHKKKHVQEAAGQPAQVQQQAVIKPKHGGGNAGVQGATGLHATTNPTLTNKQRRLLKNDDNKLPAVQANTQLQSNAALSGKGKLKIKQMEIKTAPKPNIASETFVEGKHIKGSEKWEGKQYAAFKMYKAEKHEHNWWKHHHTTIILIGGGYYYWNAGYWCPAWGYDDAYSYYPYDGPIYTASAEIPPDQVIANVQTSLQAQGYYHGEVDGLLGPLTRAAIAGYQQDHGLYVTSAIDEPTLAALGMV